MNRRNFIHTGIAAATAVPMARAADQQRPNIILLLTDDQSYRTLGCYGNTQVKTPNLDRLADDGVVFDRAYDTTAICMASRAQVMTGMYEYKTGCNFQRGPLAEEKWASSYPVQLRDAGYHTGFIGKFGFAVKGVDGNSGYHSNEDLPIDSFDEWYGWPGQGDYNTEKNEFVSDYAEKYPHVTRACGAVAQDFIKRSKEQSKPFCLSVSFKASHGPMKPDPFFNDVYADTVWEEPPNFDEAGASLRPPQAKAGRQYRHYKDFKPEHYQETMRKYNQLVYGIDYAVGMIREELERQGIAENTVILFLTDNGYSCGANGMGGKVLPYEEPSRTPMMIYDPRHPVSGTGARVKSVTANIDMAPTVLDLAGLLVPDHMDGKSLLPLLDYPSGRIHDSILLINSFGIAPTHSLAVVIEDYKYIHWPFAEGMDVAEELFMLKSDRFEMNNQVGNPEKQEVLQRMRKIYDDSLSIWEKECVAEYGYPQLGKIYDRNLSWTEKTANMDKRTKAHYLEWQAEFEKSYGSKKRKNSGKQ
ncbi:sulfatase family protein [Pontiella sulfatireligans]|uniref:Arylsulfatase n=1 Tax=Pontiella sulfatireligans TaxID=2750658 RepID=A0A6C2UJG6_9BACT|nr:sulfatase [Pontiella sulfatireligans]SPS74322.1 sulfatase S1_25 [Kiritimatiellales bacterium]VGO19346.1 Arylsulfatase [Pontiella sulfatireligans]